MTGARRWLVGGMVTASLAGALLGPVAGARAAGRYPAAGPTVAPVQLLSYSDAEGKGAMLLQDTGFDRAGRITIAVKLNRGGHLLTGTGVRMLVSQDGANASQRRFVYRAEFNLREDCGRYFRYFHFQGEIETGGISGFARGTGQYDPSRSEQDAGQWKLGAR